MEALRVAPVGLRNRWKRCCKPGRYTQACVGIERDYLIPAMGQIQLLPATTEVSSTSCQFFYGCLGATTSECGAHCTAVASWGPRNLGSSGDELVRKTILERRSGPRTSWHGPQDSHERLVKMATSEELLIKHFLNYRPKTRL